MSTLKENLKKPKTSQGFTPIWYWNGAVTSGLLIVQLNEMYKKGIDNVSIKIPDNISPAPGTLEFREIFSMILDQAAKNGQKVRLYLDLCYGDGHFLREVVAGEEEARMSYLALEQSVLLTEPKTFTWNLSGRVAHVFACKIVDNKIDPTAVKEISSSYKNGVLKWKPAAGQWRVYVFTYNFNRKGTGTFQINFLNQSAVKTYLDRVYNQLKAEVPKHLGKTLKGFQVEGPNILPDHQIHGLPWDKNFLVKAKKATKTETAKLIAALFWGTEKRTGIIRTDFYRVLVSEFGNQFVKGIAEFSKRRKFDVQLFLNNGDVFSGNSVLKLDYSQLMDSPTVEGLAGMQSFSRETMTDTKTLVDLGSISGAPKKTTLLGRNRSGLSFSLRALKFEADKKMLTGITRFMVDGCYATLRPEAGLKAPREFLFIFQKLGTVQQSCRLL